MINTEHYPFGDISTPVAVGGAVCIDKFGKNGRPIDWIAPGGKEAVHSSQLPNIVHEYDIAIDAEYLGGTAGNYATGLANTHPDGLINLFLTLSPTDPSSYVINQGLKQARIIPHITEAAHDTDNPSSLILPPDQNRRVLTSKPENARPIQMTPNGIRPGAVVLCNASGNWEQTLDNGLEYAEATGGTVVMIGSESQLKQLKKDQKKRATYRRGLKAAGAFLGNEDEAAIVVEVYGGAPKKEDPQELARQFKRLCNQDTIVDLSRGEKDVVLLDHVDNDHTLEVTPLPKDAIVNTLGAGDQFGAILLSGFRTWGTTPDGIGRSLRKAAEGAVGVLGKRDAQSGQMRREKFFAPPQPQFRHDMKSAPSWLYPTPATRQA